MLLRRVEDDWLSSPSLRKKQIRTVELGFAFPFFSQFDIEFESGVIAIDVVARNAWNNVSVHDREVAWRPSRLGLGLLAFEFGGQDAARTS